MIFDTLRDAPEDALHAVMSRCNADTRPHKIDLGVGIFRDESGASPIMRCVSEAQELWRQTETSKGYGALRGDDRFLTGMARLVFADSKPENVAAIQSVGGTGGVRLGIELARNNAESRGARKDFRVWVGTPTWPNHLGICEQLGVLCNTWPYLNDKTHQVDLDRAFDALGSARAGDVFVLHGPCHNPTGADLAPEAFLAFIKAAGEKQVIPLIDAAYYGLGGEITEDLSLLREALAETPTALLVMSCSKAFGLYRERTGILFARCRSEAVASRAQGNLEYMARGNYSMPPSHGAAVVGLVLDNQRLRGLWLEELTAMRERIVGLRGELGLAASQTKILQAVSAQKGIFSRLSLTPAQVATLAQVHAIYLPASGRINIAGFKHGDVERFTTALVSLAD